MDSAWTYFATNEIYDSILDNTKDPYEIERDIHKIINKVNKIKIEIESIHPYCYQLLSWSPYASAWQEPGTLQPKVPHDIDSSMFYCFLKQPDALELLAQSLENIANYSATKKIKNEQREQPSMRERFKQGLIYCIGKMVVFRECPISHTLMIARQVHKWATGDAPGSDWGRDPYDAIKEDLRQIEWFESAEERKQQTLLSGFPQFCESESSAKNRRGSRR